MRHSEFTPEYVETVPEELKEGRLYISKRFRTASHLCACGCGRRVVTPLKPAKWTLKEKNGAVSLCPSIGRWQLPCQSHYWIRHNKVIWSRAFSEEEIADVLRRDAEDLRDYYAQRRESSTKRHVFARLWRWVTRKKAS